MEDREHSSNNINILVADAVLMITDFLVFKALMFVEATFL